jgi:hypothetical protein
VTYDTAEARRELLQAVADATGHLGMALGWLTLAYERLDDATADELEEQLFGPVQKAYGRARRAHDGFAERFAISHDPIEIGEPHAGNRPAREMISHGVDECSHADALLSELQDSMRPVEVGDAQLRAGLTEVRAGIGHVRANARALLGHLGR